MKFFFVVVSKMESPPHTLTDRSFGRSGISELAFVCVGGGAQTERAETLDLKRSRMMTVEVQILLYPTQHEVAEPKQRVSRVTVVGGELHIRCSC